MLFLLHLLTDAAGRVQRASVDTFFGPGSTFSLASLASALALAVIVIAARRLRRRGRLSPRLIAKALWPRRAVLGASGRADIGFFFLNTFSAGGLIGWGLLSQAAVAVWTAKALASLGPTPWPATGAGPALLASLAMFLAYELAYWIDHWLSHNVPALWEIHKVHHTAEALSPLTNFRVHPLETLKFYNIAALFTGAAAGALDHVFGSGHGRAALFGTDVLFLAFMFTIAHLHHSHVWIAFRGPWAKVLMSPAAHQIHHSTDPRHFGRNLGNALALWDWLFGTLYTPTARRELLVFGVAGETHAVHGITGSLITPVIRALQTLRPSARIAATTDRPA
jgi:sterol desaturase/sphingolipid hydroxylase (fatty acid hydroxylase superfamily)